MEENVKFIQIFGSVPYSIQKMKGHSFISYWDLFSPEKSCLIFLKKYAIREASFLSVQELIYFSQVVIQLQKKLPSKIKKVLLKYTFTEVKF